MKCCCSTSPFNPTRSAVTPDIACQKFSFTAHGQRGGQKSKYNGPNHPSFFPFSSQQTLNSEMTREAGLKLAARKTSAAERVKGRRKRDSLPFSLISDVRNSRIVLWQPGKQKAKNVPNTTPGWEWLLNFGFVGKSHMHLEYIKTVVLHWFYFRRFYIGHQVQETQHSTGIVYCPIMIFNGFMHSVSSNSPHKTHCGQHTTLSSLQIKLTCISYSILAFYLHFVDSLQGNVTVCAAIWLIWLTYTKCQIKIQFSWMHDLCHQKLNMWKSTNLTI